MAGSTVVGIDLGASTSFVGYISKGLVDIVQNEVSQRATSSMVGFKGDERLLGDEALAQVKGNAKNTCRNFKHLLGQNIDSPSLEAEHFWSTSKLEASADGFTGYGVSLRGEEEVMSAVEITAGFLTKLRAITESWTNAKVTDAVVSVPSYYSDVHRQALLDAAKVANIPILSLMNEHTAVALGYGIYRSKDFDETKPMNVAFCSMGHTTFSVSIVSFIRGKLSIVSEKCDKIGGRDIDKCIMETFAAEFEKKHGVNPLSNKKAAFKLEEAVVKTKKVLSANLEAGVNCECLMEDEDFHSTIRRPDVEKMCEPIAARIQKVLDEAIASAGIALEDIESVEMVGGASRVPFVKDMCANAFGENRELSFTLNADEAVARGCALQAAILSPLYKVRDFVIEDYTPFAVSVGWNVSSAEKADADDAETEVAESTESKPSFKNTEVFPSKSRTNVVKALTFMRKSEFDIKASYADPSQLLPGTDAKLGDYRIEMPTTETNKKVKVKVRLDLSGVFTIDSAELIEEERYEEVTKEKREINAESAPAAEGSTEPAPEGTPEASTTDAPAEAPSQPAADGEKKEEKKDETPAEDEKKYEWVEVKKMKKRTKRIELTVSKHNTPGLKQAVLQTLMDKETRIQSEMTEIRETDERRNDLEGYIFLNRNKMGSDGEFATFISATARDEFFVELDKAENWLYDTYDAKKVQYVEKLNELKKVGDVVAWRFKEKNMRGDWTKAVQGTINNYRQAASEPGEKYDHISKENLQKIIDECEKVNTWLSESAAAQEKLQDHEKPVLLCTDMEKKNLDLSGMADEILKERKPAPPVEEKKEEKKDDPEVAPEAPKEVKKEDAVDDVD